MPAPVTRTDEILVELLDEVRALRADIKAQREGVAGDKAGAGESRRRSSTRKGTQEAR